MECWSTPSASPRKCRAKVAKQPQTESSGYVNSSPSSNVPLESNAHLGWTRGHPTGHQMILPCLRQLVCRVLDNYFIMREEQILINKDAVYSLPKDFLQLKSLNNRLKKSLIIRNICAWIYFWSRRSVSNTSLECNFHRFIAAKPSQVMFSPQQKPLWRSVENIILTNRLEEITRKMAKGK